jgi:hypothetical protein
MLRRDQAWRERETEGDGDREMKSKRDQQRVGQNMKRER